MRAGAAKYGSPEIARQSVAPPGKSRHNFGLAADLDYSSPQVESWMHKNANRYGLNYRMSNEDWHIEPQNSGAMMAGRQLNVAPANKALQEFGSTATSATLDLGTLGEGMGGFGKAG